MGVGDVPLNRIKIMDKNFGKILLWVIYQLYIPEFIGHYSDGKEKLTGCSRESGNKKQNKICVYKPFFSGLRSTQWFYSSKPKIIHNVLYDKILVFPC